MNSEIKNVKRKSDHIWDWISAVIVGLFTLWAIVWIVLAIVNYSEHDYAEIIEIERSIILCLIGLVIGISLLIIRIWIIFRNGRVKNLRIWGWVSEIFGALFIGMGISYFFYKYGSVFRIWISTGSIDYSRVFFASTPLLVFGVLFLVFGIKSTIHREEEK